MFHGTSVSNIHNSLPTYVIMYVHKHLIQINKYLGRFHFSDYKCTWKSDIN